MIRMDYYVRRNPSLEQEEFQALWLQEHGKLWVKHADALRLRRYTQMHDWPEHPVCETWRHSYGTNDYAYDGVATVCWASYKALEEALATPAGAQAMAEILAHEKTIVDTSNSRLSFGIVHPVINPPDKITASEESSVFRCVYISQSQPHLDLATIQRRWIAVHGGLSWEQSAKSPHKRYLQVHAVEYPLAAAWRAERGISVNIGHFGHAEAWSCPTEFQSAAVEPPPEDLFPLFLADMNAFCDNNRGFLLAGKEFHLVDEELYTNALPQLGDL
jgi:EthD domain